jgi:hypothetical protein
MRGSLACLLVALFALSPSLFAQDNPPVFDSAYLQGYALSLFTSYPVVQDYNGSGARARGMGNAFIGVSDDISAVGWNPAGLYRREQPYEQPVMGLGYRSHSADATFRDAPWEVWDEFDHSDSYGAWDMMSIIFPMRFKGHVVVASISYSRVGDEASNAGMRIDTSLFYDYEDYLAGTRRPFSYTNAFTYRSDVNALNIGFGTRMYDRLSFGLAINVYGGRSHQYVYENARWDEYVLSNLPGGQRAVVELINQVYDTTSYSGVYFTVGFQYEADRWKTGLIIKTPHTMKQTMDQFVDHRSLANGSQITGSAVGIHNDDNVTELDQPMTIGLGVSFDVKKNAMIAADIEYRAFGGSQIHVRDSLTLVPGGTDIEYFTDYDSYWNDVWALRAGGEYVWETGNEIVPAVPIRAGVGYTQIPEPNVDGGGFEVQNGELVFVPTTSTAAMTSWSVGTGMQWAQIHLDMAMVWSTYDRSDDYLLQKWSVDNTAFSVTFTGFF